MNLADVTPVILTYNEEQNIARTLEALTWARRIVVVDSHSTDATVELARQFPNVHIHSRRFDTHADQWNFGISQCDVATEWVLALDADYLVTPALLEEMQALPDDETAGYQTIFTYCVGGRPLRGSVYPPVTTIFRRVHGKYLQDGHTQRLSLSGQVGQLQAPMLHDDRKPLSRWLASQNRYMELEADKLASAPLSTLNAADRIRKLIFVAPILVLGYSLLVRGTILDGRAGLYYSMQRCVAEMILSLHLLHRKIF